MQELGTDPPMNIAPIKVLIVDDDATFSRSIGRILRNAGYDCVVAESGAEARERLHNDDDIAAVLCDLRMPGESGLDLVATLAADFSEAAVVMTTGVDDPPTAALAFEMGAYGYLIKPFTADEILITLAGALRRRELETVRQSQIDGLEQTVTHLPRLLAELRPTNRGLGSDLGPRELEVLRLMATGMPNKALAGQLHLSLNTVRNHVQHVLYKLDAHSKLEAVATAVREGVIERDDPGFRQGGM